MTEIKYYMQTNLCAIFTKKQKFDILMIFRLIQSFLEGYENKLWNM